MGTHATPPYKNVVTPGWTLDDKGQAMSKSRGNDVDPVDISSRLGGEIVRLWVASVDFREDVIGSEALMQRIGENYKKIRNTFRYILSNLYDFDPATDAVPFEQMESIDRYALYLAQAFGNDLVKGYGEFSFHKVYHRINNFCIVDLSAFYFDVLKDRLYTSAPKSQARRSAQTAIWKIGETLVRSVAPIMSFTAEEVWQYLPKLEDRPGSVHLASFTKPLNPEECLMASNMDQSSGSLDGEWNALRHIRSKVLMSLEAGRNSKLIGTGLEAHVVLTTDGDLLKLLQKYEELLRYVFIVSSVELKKGQGDGIWPRVDIRRADGQKCERCWNYSVHVGEDKTYPTVCERCSAVLKEI
jgi:isoleucyl-tRNA synthetase